MQVLGGYLYSWSPLGAADNGEKNMVLGEVFPFRVKILRFKTDTSIAWTNL